MESQSLPEPAPSLWAHMASSRWIGLLLILSSMSIVTARLFDAAPLRSANDRSRWCTVWALAERNTYAIDEIVNVPGWSTIDMVRHQDHFYSSKPPLLPRLVAEVYRAVRGVTGWTLTQNTAEVTRVILLLINILPMCLALGMFHSLIRRQCADARGVLFILVSACFATLALPFLTVFNNHSVAINCFLIALPLAIDCAGAARQPFWKFAVCGLLSAFGICNELPAGFLGLGFFVILLRRYPQATLLAFVPAALIPIAAFFWTNYEATGSWKPFYSGYGTEIYEYTYQGVPSYWSDPKGIDRPRDSLGTYLLHCLVGHHGIYSLTPIYLLTLASWFQPGRWWRGALRDFHLLGILLTLSTLTFYLTRTANYNYGGVTVALRWMLWLTPFWLLSMIPVFEQLGRRRIFQAVTVPLLAVSTFSAWYPTNAPWAKNWIYSLMTEAKWINYDDPKPVFLHRHYTWLGALPTGELQPDYWIRFVATSSLGEADEIELRDQGPADNDGRWILVRHRIGAAPAIETVYRLDSAKFQAGLPVEEFLISRRDGQSLSEPDLAFFRGMPRKMQYVSSRLRYVHLPVRVDAFRAHVGYTAVEGRNPAGESHLIIRDVWYCEEVPFGVLQWEQRVQSGSTLSAKTEWTPAAIGEYFPRATEAPF